MSQPVDQLYPTFTSPVARQQPTYAPNTTGSFAPVFIVLAAILFLSAVACVVGRFCSKWQQRMAREGAAAPTMASKLVQKQQQSHGHGLGPKMWEGRRNVGPMMNGDIEFGFDDKRKNNNGDKVGKIGNSERGKVKIIPNKNGGHRPEVRFQDNM